MIYLSPTGKNPITGEVIYAMQLAVVTNAYKAQGPALVRSNFELFFYNYRKKGTCPSTNDG